MTHLIDYSASAQGLYVQSGAAVWGGFTAAPAIPEQFWEDYGLLIDTIRYRRDGAVISDLIVKSDSFAWPLITDPASFDRETHDPGQPVMPQRFFDAEGHLILAEPSFGPTGGMYLAMEGIDDLALQFGAGLEQVFSSFAAADRAARTLGKQADALFIAALTALQDRPLAEAGRIVVESWAADPRRSIDFSLVFTPDADGGLTIGDVLQFNTRAAPGRQGAMMPFADMFAGEDAKIRLTDKADSYNLFEGFAANRLHLEAGEGHDVVSVIANDPAFMPRALILLGGAGNDMLTGDAEISVRLDGGSGNDVLAGPTTGGTFLAYGGTGNDEIRAGDGVSRLFGGDGRDSLHGSRQADTLEGGAGNDLITDLGELSGGFLVFSHMANSLRGGLGNDTLQGGSGSDTLNGDGGRDRLWGESGDDVMRGGAGFDAFQFYDRVVLDGEVILLDIGGQSVRDSGGLILVDPSASFGPEAMQRIGTDLILGDLGRSSLRIEDFYLRPSAWSAGILLQDGPIRVPDLIDFRAARGLSNTASLGTAADNVTTLARAGTHAARRGDDSVTGSAGKDRILGEEGADTIRAAGGADLVLGGQGADLLWGDAGNDRMVGGDGSDSLTGGIGNDMLLGNAAGDVLRGGSGEDSLLGGAGNDTLFGGSGDDLLRGESGADVFTFGRADGRDRIADFDSHGAADLYAIAMGDRLRLSSGLWSGTLDAEAVVARFAVLSSGALVLNFGRGDVLSLGGFSDRASLVDAIEIIG